MSDRVKEIGDALLQTVSPTSAPETVALWSLMNDQYADSISIDNARRKFDIYVEKSIAEYDSELKLRHYNQDIIDKLDYNATTELSANQSLRAVKNDIALRSQQSSASTANVEAVHLSNAEVQQYRASKADKETERKLVMKGEFARTIGDIANGVHRLDTREQAKKRAEAEEAAFWISQKEQGKVKVGYVDPLAKLTQEERAEHDKLKKNSNTQNGKLFYMAFLAKHNIKFKTAAEQEHEQRLLDPEYQKSLAQKTQN
ncbi:MAG: hypothetical protein LBG88_02025, partial [Christensenellaceae bacterium]|nr:hypothetical protein [Christensenellaceae bacterium]